MKVFTRPRSSCAHCLGRDSIDSTARLNLSGGLGLWSKLFSLPISIKGIAEADSIIAVGLDSRFYFSVVGVQIRRALKKGAHLVTIDARDSNLARYTDHWLQPAPGREGMLLSILAQRLAGHRRQSKDRCHGSGRRRGKIEKSGRTAERRRKPDSHHRARQFSNTATIANWSTRFLQLAKLPHTNFMPLYHGGNTRGALELGAFGELLPGAAESKGPGMTLADVTSKHKRPKVTLSGGPGPVPGTAGLRFIISQDIYYPPFEVDAFLPAASFAQGGGTLTNMEGRVQELVKIENPPEGAVTGFMRPDWQIFTELSQRLDCEALKYNNEAEILKEIHQTVAGFPAKPDRQPRLFKAQSELTIEKKNQSPAGKGPLLLMVEYAGFQHRGIGSFLCRGRPGGIGLGKRPAHESGRPGRLGIENGEAVTVTLNGKKMSIHAKTDSECPAGTAYIYLPLNFGGLTEFRDGEFFQALPSNPIKVNIRARKGIKKKISLIF